MGKFPEGSQSGHGKPTQCTAISKRRKKAGEAYPRCRRYATVGAKHCRFHGGEQENKPALASITHGMRSPYVKIDDVDAITTKIAQARTREGRQEMLARNTSLLQYRLEQVPLEPEHMAVAAGGAEAVRRQLETLADLDNDSKQTGSVTYVVADFDPAHQVPFLARGIDGPITVRLLSDHLNPLEIKPHMLDEQTNAWWPCVEQIDEESGAVFFTREEPSNNNDTH